MGPLEPSWRPLGSSWGHPECLGALVWRLGSLVGCLGGFWGPSWPVFGLSGPGKAPWRARAGPPPLQIDRTGLPGEGFGEGEASHTPMIPKGSADFSKSLASWRPPWAARRALGIVLGLCLGPLRVCRRLSRAILRYLGPSWRPSSWSHLGPSWTL